MRHVYARRQAARNPALVSQIKRYTWQIQDGLNNPRIRALFTMPQRHDVKDAWCPEDATNIVLYLNAEEILPKICEIGQENTSGIRLPDTGSRCSSRSHVRA